MNETKELEERYPKYNSSGIKVIDTIFSICPHANEKYVVKPKFNLLHVAIGYGLYSVATSFSFPISLFYLPVFGLGAYGIYVSRTSHQHELSHSYRLRYRKFMEEVRGKKRDSRFVSFIDKLERKSLDSSNKIKSFLSRELALLLSIPVVLGGYIVRKSQKDRKWYWEEELAKYEAVKLTGINVNSVSDEKKKFFETLESFRTDKYVPLKDCEKLDEKLRFYLEHPPAIIPKYKMIDKLYEIFTERID